MPVLQVPAGEEGGPGGLRHLLKEEEKEEKREVKKENVEEEEEREKKKENDEEAEAMEGKRRYEEKMQDCLVVEEGMMVNFPLVSLPRVSFSAALASRFFLPRIS